MWIFFKFGGQERCRLQGLGFGVWGSPKLNLPHGLGLMTPNIDCYRAGAVPNIEIAIRPFNSGHDVPKLCFNPTVNPHSLILNPT